MSHIQVIEADITSLKVDAIVNAANETLLGGGGVDGAIHRAAGPELLEACRGLNGCKTGQAKITPGFQLPARFVIHTVGPVWHGGSQNEEALLRSCYAESMKLAAQNDVSAIAFPAISCGVYRYPVAKACKIALNEIRRQLPGCPKLEQVYLVCFDEQMKNAYQHEMKASGEQ